MKETPMTQAPLRHADIRDNVRDLERGRLCYITGFVKFETLARAGRHARSRTLSIVHCRPDDPNLELVMIFDRTHSYRRPWDIQWHSHSSKPAEDVAFFRSVHEDSIGDAADGYRLSSEQMERFRQKYPPLSNHSRMLLSQWRLDTHGLILAYEAEQQKALEANA
jgi:hypothetical protein